MQVKNITERGTRKEKKHLFTVNERLAESNDTDSGNKTDSE